MKEIHLLKDIDRYFKNMNDEYDNLIQEYLDFKAHVNNKNKEKLIKQVNIFSHSKYRFLSKVKNLYIIKPDKEEK